jgi:ATP-dependent exoDNAse (exonuclease V) beta subunit
LLPKPFRDLFARWPELVVNESLCLLYVAMTRAVHALHMIVAPPRENESVWPKTFAGVLRSAFAAGQQKLEPSAVLYERGDAGCCRSSSPSVDEPPVEAVAIQLRAGGERRRRSLDRQAPSSLEGGALVYLPGLLQLDSSVATSRGSLVHAWFECVEWLDDGEPDAARLAQQGRRFIASDLDVDAELAGFRRMLREPALVAALSRGGYADLAQAGFSATVVRELRGRTLRPIVWRERSFAVRQGNTLLRGAIDRLVLLYDGDRVVAADILDYKTDRVSDPSAIAQRVEHYAPQIEAYRSAVAQFMRLPLSHVAARLLFVAPGVVRCV